MTYMGQPVPNEFRRHVLDRAEAGKSPQPLFLFWEKLQRNPSKRSVDQLFPFIAKKNIPITADGCFLAYKGVRSDYMDKHSGTILNKPGTTVSIPRNQVSDDPKEACHFGLHVGAEGYASNFSDRQIICKVDPENVVCVPYDHYQEKMRVCKYDVIGHKGDTLPDSMFEPDELETVRDTAENIEEVVEEEIDTSKQAERLKKKQKKGPLKAKRVEKKLNKSGYEKFNKMNAQELMNQSLDDLRKYATYGLEIVGASKIPGGKAKLVSRLLQVRKKILD